MTSKKVWRARAKHARQHYQEVLAAARPIGAALIQSMEITRAVHAALEAVEAPPAESMAGRITELHRVLEAQWGAVKRTADNLLVEAAAAATTYQQRTNKLDVVLRGIRSALDAVGAPDHSADTADRVRALAQQRNNWQREAAGAVAVREERDRLKARVDELATLANTRAETIRSQAAELLEAEAQRDAARVERDRWKAAAHRLSGDTCCDTSEPAHGWADTDEPIPLAGEPVHKQPGRLSAVAERRVGHVQTEQPGMVDSGDPAKHWTKPDRPRAEQPDAVATPAQQAEFNRRLTASLEDGNQAAADYQLDRLHSAGDGCTVSPTGVHSVKFTGPSITTG